MSLLNAHWFDVVVLVVLIVGFKLGQRKEALPQFLTVAHWGLTLVICLFLYKAPAIWLAGKWSMQPDTLALIIFPIEFLVVFFLLNFMRRRMAKEIAEKEPFGTWEPRITKAAGALRFFVYMLVVMAWINGRYVTDEDIREHEAFCKENFGGITFPVLCTVHDDMFNGSYSGKFAKEYLSGVLMTAIPRFEYAEEPSAPVVTPKRTVKLRELDNDFDKKDEKLGVDGKEKNAVKAVESKGPGSGQIVYHDIALKGISGSADRLFALINDQTFNAGELGFIKLEDRKISVLCLQILESSVVVRLDYNTNSIELKLGVATDSKGVPLIKE